MASASEVYRKSSVTYNLVSQKPNTVVLPSYSTLKFLPYSFIQNYYFTPFIVHFSSLSKLNPDWLKPFQGSSLTRAVNCF